MGRKQFTKTVEVAEELESQKCKVTISGKEYLYEKGTSYQEIAKDFQKEYKHQIALVMLDGHRLQELRKQVSGDCTLQFITTQDTAGYDTYRRSVCFLFIKAVHDVIGHECPQQVRVRIHFSLGAGFYCTVEGIDHVGMEFQWKVEERMYELVQQRLPITKELIHTEEAVELFHRYGMFDKERLFRYRRSSHVNLYAMNEFRDYYYGYMVPSTGYLGVFDLELYEDGFVLLFPNKKGDEVEPLHTSNKLYHTLKESRSWSRMLDVGTIGALNDAIASGRGEQIILLQEALMEERIGSLAAQIAAKKGIKFVMIAGPSSSGKTTFSNRLSIQLLAKGRKPHPISLDDYYDDRERCPRDADGNLDFECLEALDVRQFNEDMTRLLAGEKVDMPSFNFKTGKREYRGRTLQLKENDILVIEGIHGLNDKLSYTLPAESKFKIYISALTQLNIDEHNPLSTTDCRLLRRIVRDARTRGTTAQETIAMWKSVRRGEEKNIFPFQDSADVMFNSALLYEVAVLKVYAEPLLFQIPRDSAEYLEAKRLLKFLDYFLPLPTEGIAQSSLVREFVGGSCFNV